MLKYLYKNSKNTNSLINITEQKIINDSYTNKFYIRSSLIENQEVLILDNNSKFLLLNKKNIEKYISFFKNDNLLGKTLQLQEFIYSKKNYFKIKFYIGNKVYNNYLSYLKLLYILKKSIKINIDIIWPILIVNRGNFSYIFNGLRGILPRKSFVKLRKILKNLRVFLSMKEKFLILLKKYKKLILKSLLLKNLKANKIFINKHKYKNQLRNKNLLLKTSFYMKSKRKISKK